MRVVRAIGAAAVAILVAASGVAVATAPEHVGWWWRAQTGTGPSIPSPAHVPQGGLWVAHDPSGDLAVAALRFDVPARHQVSAVRLDVFQQHGSPTLVACPAAGTWTAVEGGTWSSRPRGNCASTKTIAATEGATLVLDVEGFARDGVLDLVLVPLAGSGTWSVSFNPPDGDTLTVAPMVTPTPSPTDRPAATTTTGATGDASAPAPAAAIWRRANPLTVQSAATPSPSTDVPEALAVRARPIDPIRTRQPLALAVVAALIATWIIRTRQAVAGAQTHTLARPIVPQDEAGFDARDFVEREAP